VGVGGVVLFGGVGGAGRRPVSLSGNNTPAWWQKKTAGRPAGGRSQSNALRRHWQICRVKGAFWGRGEKDGKIGPMQPA